MVADRYEADWSALLQAGAPAGPEWMDGLRRHAMEGFERSGVPRPTVEDWKYTPLRSLAESRLELAPPGPAVFEFPLPAFEPDAIRVVLVDGRLDRNLSTGVAPGLTACSLLDALHEHETVVRMHIGNCGPVETQAEGRAILPDSHPFGDLNLALFQDGAFLRFHANQKVEQLVEVVHVATGAPGSASLPRLLIVAEPGSRGRIVECYVSSPGFEGAVFPTTEVSLDEGAWLEHVRVQDQSTSSAHIGLWQARLDAGSKYVSTNVAFGSALGRLEQGVWIGGSHAHVRMDGVVVATGAQHLDNHTRLDHAVPECDSFEVYKQVADDEGRIVFNGKIFVHQDAQKTDAKQTNQAILLSPRAEVDSKPQLEIFADDVKCTHGATVGQIEDSSLFYLRSRGIPAAEAEAVLVYAFAAEVLEQIPTAAVRDALEAHLFEKLGVPAP
jgi:Fe-S cluster assembly protein SufD